METELHTKLLDALKLTAPNIGKDYLYDRCVTKYINAMLPAISKALAHNFNNKKLLVHEFLFSHSKIREEIGTIGKQQQYIYQLMKSNNSTSLLIEISKGYSKNRVSKLSTVRINPIYKELILEELLNLRIEANQQLLEEIEDTSNYIVNVDPLSLASYIKETVKTIRTTTKGEAYKDKLLRNLVAARQLQTMIHSADEINKSPYIKERWEIADCGRIYGQGYSLQRMPKEVRHAALGVCHKYDFKASAFAIMAGLAHAINPTLKLGAILDYVKNRQAIRKRIATELNISEELVKTIFTALGFGAELKNNQHNAIRGELAKAARMRYDTDVRLERDVYNNLGADEFLRLAENQTFRFIYEELQIINNTIIEYFKINTLEFEHATYSDIDTKTGKKRTDKQKLAWIYQALESMAMKEFCKLAEQEALLTTHDCVYFKQKLSADNVKDITYQLQHTFPYLRFEHDPIYPIVEDSYYSARFAETEKFEREHMQCLAEQEEIAQIYYANKLQQQLNATTTHSTF